MKSTIQSKITNVERHSVRFIRMIAFIEVRTLIEKQFFAKIVKSAKFSTKNLNSKNKY